MIYTDDNNVLQIVHGKGDVLSYYDTNETEGIVMVCFAGCESGDIGVKPRDTTVEGSELKCVMTFDKVESMEVIIDTLIGAHKELISIKGHNLVTTTEDPEEDWDLEEDWESDEEDEIQTELSEHPLWPAIREKLGIKEGEIPRRDIFAGLFVPRIGDDEENALKAARELVCQNSCPGYSSYTKDGTCVMQSQCPIVDQVAIMYAEAKTGIPRGSQTKMPPLMTIDLLDRAALPQPIKDDVKMLMVNIFKWTSSVEREALLGYLWDTIESIRHEAISDVEKIQPNPLQNKALNNIDPNIVEPLEYYTADAAAHMVLQYLMYPRGDNWFDIAKHFLDGFRAATRFVSVGLRDNNTIGKFQNTGIKIEQDDDSGGE